MVSKAYKTALMLVEKMVNLHRNVLKDGFINQVSQQEFEEVIAKHVGADQRTIDKYLRVCVQFGFLKSHIEVNKREKVYLVNVAKADKEMREVFGRNLRQIKLLE